MKWSWKSVLEGVKEWELGRSDVDVGGRGQREDLSLSSGRGRFRSGGGHSLRRVR